MSTDVCVTSDAPLALELINVTKDFGGLRAVNNVSLKVRAGERRAIIGPNGAGKTTLFNLITGQFPVTSGKILLFGRDITRLPMHKRIALGMGRTYQITRIFPELTVEENVILAIQGLRPLKFDMFRPLRRHRDVQEKAHELMENLGISDKAKVKARELSYGDQRQLEIALAMASDPKVLLLDEPAAGLSPAERVTIANLIRRLPKSLTLVLIEHDMDLALGLVDQVACLHFGECIADETPDCIRANEMIQQIYLGGE
jgi:branched-chain amino acid transport system ATP-binding protein